MNAYSKLQPSEAVVVSSLIIESLLGKRARVIKHDSILTGAEYYRELMETNSEERFHEIARMDRPSFLALVDLLKENGGLTTSQGRCYLQDKIIEICPGERLMIFISILVGFANRTAQERWQHSGSTISTTIHDVAHSILRCKDYFIRTPREDDPTHAARIMNDPKYIEFIGCLGALDGSHVPAVVSSEDAGKFRNRKKFISQNVLGVCDFDMLFIYCLAGWEGSAHDGRVLADAVTRDLALFENRYYLGDAGYALSRYVLTPYRGVRYHLKEFSLGSDKPQNKEELFNLRHASLRNVVERIYGVVKKRFPILSKMASFNFRFQIDLVRCAILLHNGIRLNKDDEDEFDILNEEELENQNPAGNVRSSVSGGQTRAEVARLNQWCDGIAQRT